ncbi:hypothetical protein H5P28_17250 [Ruficoccus amylovorans]|uniref:Uncharacterized protein n=1 Tax=Ruficoccus amylovorans TaxID=1804625 RepID=A0A842HKE8_9BACT|nr:hypothetical protein [Ruficoccus amylovorans]MBC2596016.1 hypothetical protein [Ruficoccus amylovorans]
MNYHHLIPLVAFASTGIVTQLNAQSQVFGENFDGLTSGVTITTENTDFTYVRTAGAAPYNGTLTTQNSSFGSGTSLRLLSSGYGSTPNFVGVGANDLAKSSVYSLSVDLTTNLWQTGSSSYIMMGDWTTGSANQVYNPNTTITTNGVSHTTIGQQSLFALRIVGSTALSGGYLQTINQDGSTTNIVDGNSNQIVLSNTGKYSLHIVANGSSSAIELDGQTIGASTMGIYLNNVLLGFASIAEGVEEASAFRIFSSGNSSGNLQNIIELDNFNLWDGAVSPIPESSSYGIFAGLAALCLLGVMRRKKSCLPASRQS